MEATPAICVQGLHKRFRKSTIRRNYSTLKTLLVGGFLGRHDPGRTYLQVLDGIDLDVAQGTTLGVIGRNGSGKSTLLKIIAGIMQPDQGTVEVRGKVSPLIELGAGFHPDFSGRENVFLNGMVLGMSRNEIEARFDAIVDFAGLAAFIDDPVRTYSSGMYMRLAFSVATHAEPDILLIDEILAVGDEDFQRKCKDRLSAFQAAGTTMVLVSHDSSTIEKWCHEAVFLEEGRITRRGVPGEIVTAYHATLDRKSPDEVAAEAAAQISGKLRAGYRLVGSRSIDPFPVAGAHAFRALVELTNTGEAPWHPAYPTANGSVMLGGRLYRDDEPLGEIDRAMIPRIVPSGETTQVELVFRVPGPGRYRLEIDLVVEGVCWFGQQGSPVFPLELEAPPT